MSTATEEPPKQQEQVQPTPEERKANALNLLRPKVQVDGIVHQAPPPLEKKTEPPKEEKKPEEQAKVTDPKEVSIAELRKSRDEERKRAEEAVKNWETEKAERARLLAEYEEHKKKPASEDFLKKHQELESRAAALDQELRAAALERSPSFRKEFNDRINQNASSMVDLMVQSGVEKADAVKAINGWNEDFFASATEGMTAPQKIKFNAAWMQAEQIENDRKAALANADAEWKKREGAQQEQLKAQQEQQQQFLQSEEAGMFKELFSTEGLSGNTELQDKAREAVKASYAFTPRQLMHAVATSRILADRVLGQEEELKTLRDKVAEQEEFIKNANSGTARISPTDGEKGAPSQEERKAKAKELMNPKFSYQS